MTLHSLYQAGLRKYLRHENGPPSAFNRLFAGSISMAVRFLSWRSSMAFPAGTVGGWYWVDRFRFELLMEWFEFDEVQWCKRLIKPGMTVLDIGAHVGYYSILFSRLVGPRGRVLAFEINPENFQTASRNLRARNCRNAEVYPFGVCDETAARTLHISPGHSNHSLMAGYTRHRQTMEVACVALDDFLREREIGPVDFIKSDTEGAELLVVAGARRTLREATRMNLLMEYNPQAIECGGQTAPELLAQLGRFGFDCRAILPGGELGPVPPLAQGASVNLLCTKSDAAGPCLTQPAATQASSGH